jgi:hypothetical protein
MSATSNTGSTGEDGSSITDRVNRYGISTAAFVQNDEYKRITGLDVVVAMIIGDGDASRADRLNIFNADITSIGIYSGSHQDLGHQSCVVLA